MAVIFNGFKKTYFNRIFKVEITRIVKSLVKLYQDTAMIFFK